MRKHFKRREMRGLTEEQWERAGRYYRLALALAYRFCRRSNLYGYYEEFLAGLAVEDLVKAARAYDPERYPETKYFHFKLRSLLVKSIDHAMIRFNSGVGTPAFNSAWNEEGKHNADRTWSLDLAFDVHEAIGRLPEPLKRYALDELEGVSIQDRAKLDGISYSAARKRRLRAHEILAEHLSAYAA